MSTVDKKARADIAKLHQRLVEQDIAKAHQRLEAQEQATVLLVKGLDGLANIVERLTTHVEKQQKRIIVLELTIEKGVTS